MDMDPNRPRLVGDYILGPRIGSGSFAVVWLSRHRQSGKEVAVKEIDKKLLNPKVSESLLKEISILSTIDHPNIVRLLESIETKDRIFLVLEYCDGGDLAAYIQLHGRVAEAVARHFMRQLAAGLQVLQEKHLIHRDLKPQNLFLVSNDATPQLKIGDFGFARSLSNQELADTLCGSPLYMAPEIIQHHKYDAKADLWSVGAILFQLVIGKPPFGGNNQYQLFQNILASAELQFPQGALKELHPDCVDLCRSLLRQNPVERLSFIEFFNHKFLQDLRLPVGIEESSVILQRKAVVESLRPSAAAKKPHLLAEHLMYSTTINHEPSSSFALDNVVSYVKDNNTSASRTKSFSGSMPNTVPGKTGKSADINQCSSDHLEVSDSMESIEKDYVLVNRHFSSSDNFSYYLATSLQEKSTTRVSMLPPRKNNHDAAAGSVGTAENSKLYRSKASDISLLPSVLRDVQGLSILHPSARLHLLYQYALAVAELALEKYNAGLLLESFSVQLVVLAMWKKALQTCSSWLASTPCCEVPEPSAEPDSAHQASSGPMETITSMRPSSALKWAEEGFLLAFDRAEKLSHHLRDTDAIAEIPDAMEIIFQKALALGTSGAVDEYMENKSSAAVSYSKAMLLLHFIVEEAASLPLNPPFSLTHANKRRIQSYITNLQSRQSHFLTLQPTSKQSP